MSNTADFEGTPVTEEHVAHELGFNNIYEYRRFQTKYGQQVFELERQLKAALREQDDFQRTVKRMCIVLEKLKEVLTPDSTFWKEVLAIEVVLGQGVDWDKDLKDWGL